MTRTLTLSTCPDDATLDANLLRVYRMASPYAVENGRTWYEDANETCRTLSQRYGRPLYIVAAVVAVLSPSVEWRLNVRAAEAILSRDTTMMRDDGTPGNIVGYGRNIAKARHIVETNDVSVMRGPKVVRFFCNIMHLSDDATIDVHAVQAALLSTSHDTPGSQYHRIADAYARCAASVWISVPDFQAIVWITWRGLKKNRSAMHVLKEGIYTVDAVT